MISIKAFQDSFWYGLVWTALTVVVFPGSLWYCGIVEWVENLFLIPQNWQWKRSLKPRPYTHKKSVLIFISVRLTRFGCPINAS